MKKIISCIIARTVSKRLPLKVLRDIIPGQTILDYLIKNLKSFQPADNIYICTSKEQVDDILEDLAARNGIKIYRGSAENVLERMISVGKIENADILIRITGDNPFSSFEYLGKQIDLVEKEGLDYVRLSHVPLGATAEVIDRMALERCSKIMNPLQSEYMMLYMFEPRSFRCGVVEVFKDDYSNFSLTVDTDDDYRKAKQIAQHLIKRHSTFTLNDIIPFIQDHESVIPGLKIAKEAKIKLPDDKTMSYEEFTSDMHRRINHSLKVCIHE
jgi:spore coat polysaccharide biosynthesis protein SpsF